MVTIDSTLKEIMGVPEAVEAINKILPGFSKNPMLRMGYKMTLRKICAVPAAGVSEENAKLIEEALLALAK